MKCTCVPWDVYTHVLLLHRNTYTCHMHIYRHKIKSIHNIAKGIKDYWKGKEINKMKEMRCSGNFKSADHARIANGWMFWHSNKKH